ncbi:Acetolactate synthase small subunit [hydrothermal vent metagenome]|uniref:Acetolactate synthase small subunit n=1 Tax=hydrothermal vent metagenome TaxID=652676 RepID=A0A3B1E9H2_9ZZZZ
MQETTRKIISIIVTNEHGVLARISGLFAGRGYNIESLTVSAIPKSNYSRITLVTNSSKSIAEQIIKQLDKLIPVKEVIQDNLIEKEMVLIKFSTNSNLGDIDVLCRTYNGHIVNVTKQEITAMVLDDAKKIESFISVVDNYNPIAIVRSGAVAIEQEDNN